MNSRQSEDTMLRPLWQIDKGTTHGTTFRLTVGIPGIPGSHHVQGLSHDQAEALEIALDALEKRAAERALQSVRDALGV